MGRHRRRHRKLIAAAAASSLPIQVVGQPPAVPLRYSDSIIVPQARDRLLEILQREQLPDDIRGTLQGAIGGDLRLQILLFQAMLDTWPRLQKCIAEVQRAVRKAPWKAIAWAPRGAKPTAEAEQLAQFVDTALWSMRPDPIRSRKGFEGTVDSLVLAYFFGVQVCEIHWTKKFGVLTPESTKIVPPRFYGYPWDVEGEDRLMLDPEGMGGFDLVDFPPHRFLVAVNSVHGGHPTQGAPLRVLTGWWLAAIYGPKWLMQYGELFGQPIRWANYAAGDDESETKVKEMMENIGSAAWGIFPTDTKVQFVESTKSASTLPQVELIRQADEQCEITILGQTLTSSQGKTGAKSLGEVHMDVRSDVFVGVCDFVGEILTWQLSADIVAVNYGEGRHDIPGVWAVFPEVKDAKAMAERDQILGVGDRLPVEKAWYYERHDIPVPAPEADLFVPAVKQADPAANPGAPPPEDGEDEGAPPEAVAAADASTTWRRFPASAGSLNIPRAEMPQIRAGDRAALVQFLRARGIESQKETAQADTLRPSQAEFSPEKVQQARDYRGGNRSILISEDGHVVDGHHQWLAADGGEVQAIRIMAPIHRVLMLAHRMPSSTVAAGRRDDLDDGRRRRDPAPLTVDTLSGAVLEGLTGVTREWLAPVRPVFERLAALAMAKNVTDEDFVAALEKAQREMPDLFEAFDVEVLQDAFEDAIGSAMLAGSTSRYEP